MGNSTIKTGLFVDTDFGTVRVSSKMARAYLEAKKNRTPKGARKLDRELVDAISILARVFFESGRVLKEI